jgi:hypothetical protein
MQPIYLHDIHIRTTLQPGDIGYVAYLHGHLYSKEYNYGILFETYVAAGLVEFTSNMKLPGIGYGSVSTRVPSLVLCCLCTGEKLPNSVTLSWRPLTGASGWAKS